MQGVVFAQETSNNEASTELAARKNQAAVDFSAGLTALEKQDFRTARNSFRSSYLLDSANMTTLRHFAKALFYAEYKNIDSVRFVRELLRVYDVRGGEANPLWQEKGNILKKDVGDRLDVLIADSLQAAQKEALRFATQYQYSYRATAVKPLERPKDSLSLAGKSIWTASFLIQAGVMLQPNRSLDHWGDVSLGVRGAFWGKMSETADIGGDVGIHGTFGAMLESGSVPTRIDTGSALRRMYSGELGARLRFYFHNTGVFAVGGYGRVENTQTLGNTPENIATSALRGIPFHLVGAGLHWEPREGAEGLLVGGRFFFVPFLGTYSKARMITALVGYSFGRAALTLDALYAERSESTSTLAARVSLHWHFLQAVSEKKSEETP